MIRLGAAAGSVGIGAGGSYTSYSFDPSTGLSNDPSLASYLQNLTPAQLQSALNGGNTVTEDLQSLFIDDLTGTGAGNLPPGAPPSNPSLSGIPTWAYFAAGGALLLLLVRR